jgi:hypothetical protein
MGKPLITTTFAGFPDMVVDRVRRLVGPNFTKASARANLDHLGFSVVNFGDPYDPGNDSAPSDADVVQAMREVLKRWA